MTDLITAMREHFEATGGLDTHWAQEAIEALEDAVREKREADQKAIGQEQFCAAMVIERDSAFQGQTNWRERAEAAEAKIERTEIELHGIQEHCQQEGQPGIAEMIAHALLPDVPDKASGEAVPTDHIVRFGEGLWKCTHCRWTSTVPEILRHAPDCPFAQQGENRQKCELCDGRGEMSEPMGGGPCTYCGGEGYLGGEPAPGIEFRKIIAAEEKSGAGLAPFLHALSTAEQRGRAKALVQGEPNPDGGERFKPFPLVTNDSGTVVWIVTDQGVHMTSKEAAQRIATALEERDRLGAALIGAVEKLSRETFCFEETPEYEEWIALVGELQDASKEQGDG